MVIEAGVLLVMILFALLAIHSSIIRLSVVYLAVFSLLAGFLYLLFAAPELAIAEAVIGSGIVTLLYLAALQRNHVYTIGVVPSGDALTDRHVADVESSQAFQQIRDFFVRREFEVQLVFLSVPVEEALLDPSYDLVVAEDKRGIAVYSDEDSYIMVELEVMLQMHGAERACRFIRYSSDGVL